MMNETISDWIWRTRYRRQGEKAIIDSWKRVAKALASVESDPKMYYPHFLSVLHGFRFLPGGRIMAGAGSGREVTLFNCFVMGNVEDSLDGIFRALRESALTMQMGGGIGVDFSTLRPAGSHTQRVGSIASGPVSFMHVWDSMCATLLSSGNRRGAMMATLRCDHPDIEAFITAKQNPGILTHFNLSVLVSDAFMRAVEADDDWPLIFPAEHLGKEAADKPFVESTWPGSKGKVMCRVMRVVKARELWQRMTRSACDSAEPGVLFVDTINQMNNLGWCETISATNPCGEIPLPPYGGCDLGSVNLTKFVHQPFEDKASIDWESLDETVRRAVRMLDNAIELSRYPLPQQKVRMLKTRRIGLGITGLADALMMMNIRYGDDDSYQFTSLLMKRICHTAYRASIALAEEKGAFPAFDADAFLESHFVRELPDDIRHDITEKGIRNSHLLAIAPAGTISLLAGNISSGLEPVFESEFHRRVRGDADSWMEFDVVDHAVTAWRNLHDGKGLPPHFVAARDLSPRSHLRMQASLQPFVDSAISKTINLPAEASCEEFADLYAEAWRLGLKGCTLFRPNAVTGAVLDEADAGCCGLDREGA